MRVCAVEMYVHENMVIRTVTAAHILCMYIYTATCVNELKKNRIRRANVYVRIYILYIMCERAHVFNNCLQKPSGSIECGNITLQF